MKKIFTSAILILLLSCSTPDKEKNDLILCGTCSYINPEYENGQFVGVAYSIVLDTPYFDGTTYYSNLYFIKKDNNNTPQSQEYAIGQNVCASGQLFNL